MRYLVCFVLITMLSVTASFAAQTDDIVVIGYGEVRRKDLTGSLGSMKVDEVVQAPVASLEVRCDRTTLL